MFKPRDRLRIYRNGGYKTEIISHVCLPRISYVLSFITISGVPHRLFKEDFWAFMSRKMTQSINNDMHESKRSLC